MDGWLSQLEWEHPKWLLLLIPIMAFWICLSLFAWVRNNAARNRFAAPEMFRQLGQQSLWNSFLPLLVLQLVGVIGITLALAAPKFGELEQPVTSSGHDIYVLLDVSRSMLAEDVSPSRLERAKADIASLTSRLKGERIGLIVFAGQPVIRCPLTVDYENFRKAVANVDLISSPRGGTAIGKAIRKSLDMFKQAENSKHTILLITDGDDQNSDPIGAARLAQEMQVAINVIGLGDTSTGARVPTAPSGRSYVEYEGEQVWSKLDSDLLNKVADLTGGSYIGVGTKSLNIDMLYEQCLVRSDVGNASHTETITTKAEQYQWPLGVGTLSILASLFIGSRKTNSHRGRLMRGAAGSMLFLCSLGAASVASAGQVDALNTSGLEHFHAGDLLKASEEFERAKSLLNKEHEPVRAIIDFNLGCVAQANGDFEKAIRQYEMASRSQDLNIIAAAQYQLGNVFVEKLVSQKAKKTTSLAAESTEASPPPEPILLDDEIALRAIEAYENTLSINPLHPSATKKLQSIKLWLASERSNAKTLARQSASEQLSFLNYLEQFIERQNGIAFEASQLTTFRKLQEQHALRIRQMEIIDELPLLTAKLQTEISPPQTSDRESPSESSPMSAAIEQVANKLSLTSQTMEQCVAELASFRPVAATQNALSATQELEDLWNAIANYEQLLTRAYQAQTELVDSSAPSKANSQSAFSNEVGNPKHHPSQNWSQSQFRNVRRASAIETKAKLMADQIREQLEQREKGAEQIDASPSDAAEQTAEERDEDSLATSLARLENALNLAPQAISAMEKAIEAADASDKPQSTSVHQHAMEAKKILEELLNSLPPPETDDNQQQDSQNSDSSDQQKESNKSESQNSESNDPQSQENKSPESQSSESESPEQQSQDDQSEDKQSQEEKSQSNPQSEQPNDSQNQPEEKSENEPDQQQSRSNADEGKSDERSEEPKELAEEEADSKEKDGEDENKKTLDESPDQKQEQASQNQRSDEKGSISSGESDETGQQILVSQERMEEIMRKVKEREAAKRIRDKKLQELLRSRQRVEKDW